MAGQHHQPVHSCSVHEVQSAVLFTLLSSFSVYLFSASSVTFLGYDCYSSH